MQATTKKEVSCKAVEPLFKAFKTKNLDENLLLLDISYDSSYLKNIHERIEWSIWCKLIANARPFFNYSEFEEMGENVIRSGSYIIGMFFGFFLFSTNKIARLLNKQVFKLVGSTFSCIKQRTEYLTKNKIKVTGFLEEGYEFCPEFWHISKGAWKQSAIQIGHKEVKVDLKLHNNEAIFEVSWKTEGIGFEVRKAFRWIFNIRKAFLELTESHQTLLNQYQDLDESKILLQKQTTQLKTAYEISTSIRQSLNIIDTLKAIADSMVKEAGFSTVFIELNKDLEGNDLNIKFQSGAIKKYSKPIHRELVIRGNEIGDIISYPPSEKDITEINELLDYITPIVNITIHDALVFRAVSDYKDNLEHKVADRTIELQNARDELSDTNKLLKEAHQTQNRFFTNISHEFRTPLTLILGPAKRLLERTKDKESKADADFIHRSAKKLNRLVDELLDISKIESGEMKIKTSPVNLVTIVKELAFSFSSLADSKKITFDVNNDKEEIIAYIDKDKFDKILSNVLANAFKFTPEGGRVELEIQASPKSSPKERTLGDVISPPGRGTEGVGATKGLVEISISDTGTGIPQNQIDKIFDRFYQVDGSHIREHEGTGIGLSLTKELVELHKGKIIVESKEGKGSTFRIFFPLGKDHLKPEEICEESLSLQKESFGQTLSNGEGFSEEIIITEETKTAQLDISFIMETEKPLLLIVEDNPDVREYIKIILGKEYRIFEAKDGEEGLDKSFVCIPDLIISDIMMPKMDGFQMCSKLKTDSRTSHIPIIMLTAKATMQDKISGLEIGADEYIMKPFEAEELKARIKNLLEQRKRLHEHFRQFGLVEIDKQNITSVDRKFLQKAVAVINEHISDTSFGVEIMADDLAVSRSFILKKINALIGEPPSDWIKRTRLNKAAKLIENNFGNISEIALDVGFNNPSYFAEAFKKQFGVAPSQYHRKL